MDGEKVKVAVKSFSDWAGFKWSPVALYALGVQDFAVSGQARMMREYLALRFLRGEGLNVPLILTVNWNRLLLVREFVDGFSLTSLIRKIASTDQVSDIEDKMISKVGAMIANVHEKGIVIGDLKPDGVILSNKGKIFIVDFEQARKGENFAWDIAEFLYFSAHHFLSIRAKPCLLDFVGCFIRGYLEGGGSQKNVAIAGRPEYARLFSLICSPIILRKVSQTCRQYAL